MFSALMVVRLREAVMSANVNGTKSWVSPDHVSAVALPLAKAAEKVLGSMHRVLVKTKEARDRELESMGGPLGTMEKERDSKKRLGLRRTKAAEVKIVRCLEYLRDPSLEFKAQALDLLSKETSNDVESGEGIGEETHDVRQGEGSSLQHLAGMNVNDQSSAGLVDPTLPQSRD